jgi:hypothetical protein
LASDWLGNRRSIGGLGRKLVADLSHGSFLSESLASGSTVQRGCGGFAVADIERYRLADANGHQLRAEETA